MIENFRVYGKSDSIKLIIDAISDADYRTKLLSIEDNFDKVVTVDDFVEEFGKSPSVTTELLDSAIRLAECIIRDKTTCTVADLNKLSKLVA